MVIIMDLENTYKELKLVLYSIEYRENTYIKIGYYKKRLPKRIEFFMLLVFLFFIVMYSILVLIYTLYIFIILLKF